MPLYLHTIERSASPEGYRVTIREQVLNVGGRPTGLVKIHELGHVKRDADIPDFWTAYPSDPVSTKISGYATRKAAAECLFDDWAATHHHVLRRLRLGGAA